MTKEQFCACLDNECCPDLAPGFRCKKQAASKDHCVKHGPHAPGECPQCDELAEARSIVATTYIPPAPPSSNLRACPFCGRSPESHQYAIGGKSYAWVRCEECNLRREFNVQGESEGNKTLAAEAIARWWNGSSDETNGFQCKANRTADPPQDCDWPHCGCDPAADRVLAALQEEGFTLVPPSRNAPERARPEKTPNKSGVEYMRELVTYCGLTQQAIFGIPFSRQLEFLLEQLANAQDDALALHHAYVDLKYPQTARSPEEPSRDDARDAARYRWLRQARGVYDDTGRFPQGEDLDECCDAFMAKQGSSEVKPTAECNHPRSELLARKGDAFEMRKCHDCTKIFRVRLPEKAPVKAGDPCPTFDSTVHEAHNGKCMYCGAPMAPVKAAEPEALTEAEQLLQAWADLLPPNGNLYWVHIEKARDYFKRRSAKETSAPLPPEVLANALQDVVHVDDGPVRAGRSVKASVPPEDLCLVAGCRKPAVIAKDGSVGALCEEHNGNVGIKDK